MNHQASIDVLDRLLNVDVLVPTLICGTIVISLIVKAVVGMVTGLSRERTRREIAAYIAEGSMSPEQGERLLKAGDRNG